jgi:hypothetical protein
MDWEIGERKCYRGTENMGDSASENTCIKKTRKERKHTK